MQETLRKSPVRTHLQKGKKKRFGLLDKPWQASASKQLERVLAYEAYVDNPQFNAYSNTIPCASAPSNCGIPLSSLRLPLTVL